MKEAINNIITRESETTMHFDNRNPITFKQSLEELLGNADISTAIDKLEESIKNYAAGNKDIAKTAMARNFHQWVRGIHEHVVPTEGQRFPKNLFYAILSNLREQDKNNLLDDKGVLSLYVCDGLNARKISKGETPSLDFIATAAALKVARSLANLNIADEATMNFLAQYNATYTPEIKQAFSGLVQNCTELKNSSSFYNKLASSNFLNLDHNENQETGANSYSYSPEKLAENAKQLSGVSDQECTEMAAQIQDLLTLPAFNTIREKITTKSLTLPDKLALWDCSEWIGRLDLALDYAKQVSPENTQLSNVIDALSKDPLFAEIQTRNKSGDYPARERKQDLEQFRQVTSLFKQDELSKSPREQKLDELKTKTPILS